MARKITNTPEIIHQPENSASSAQPFCSEKQKHALHAQKKQPTPHILVACAHAALLIQTVNIVREIFSIDQCQIDLLTVLLLCCQQLSMLSVADGARAPFQHQPLIARRPGLSQPHTVPLMTFHPRINFGKSIRQQIKAFSLQVTGPDMTQIRWPYLFRTNRIFRYFPTVCCLLSRLRKHQTGIRLSGKGLWRENNSAVAYSQKSWSLSW